MALSQRFDRFHTGWTGYLVGVFGLVVLYYATARIGLTVPFVGQNVTLIWPPTGIAVAVLYRFGLRYWPGVVIAALGVNLELSSWWAALGIAAGNTLAPVAAVTLLKSLRFKVGIPTRTDIVRFVGGGAFLPMILSGLNGPVWLVVDEQASWSQYGRIAWTWWLGDSFGVLVFGLPLIATRQETWTLLKERPLGRILGLLIVLVASLVFLGPILAHSLFRTAAVLLPTLCAVVVTVRYGLTIGAYGSLAIASVAVFATAAGSGPFAQADVHVGLLSLWAYIGGVTTLNLVLAAVLAERDRAELAYRTTERLFRSIVDDNPALICEFDAQGIVQFVNRSYTRAVGKSVRLLGHPFLEGTSHDAATIRNDLANLQPGSPLTYEVLTQAHDNPRWHRWVIHAVGDPDSVIVSYQAVGLDVTELRKIEAERRALEVRVFESQKAESLSVIAGGMAHEFNNLLTVIVGNAELTAMTLPTDAPAHAQLQQIEHAARRATDLTRQLLAYAGKSQIHTKSTDLNLLLWEARLQRTVPAGVALQIDACEALPKVLADESQLRHVVVNLLANAIEALDGRPGAIAMRTDAVALPSSSAAGAEDLPAGSYVRFQISDTGAGMSEDVQARIFEPFFTTKFTGRGLGLAAVQGIVRSHGGTIGVRSRPGRGAEFTVLLPAEVGDVRVAAARPVALVIDADDGDCVPGHRALTDLNWEVAFAADGPSGVALFRQFPDRFGLVLVGLSPAEAVETETLEKLRGIRAQVPILVCARLTEYSLPDLTSFHPAAFLLKPYGTDDVREAIERVKNGRPGRVNNGN